MIKDIVLNVWLGTLDLLFIIFKNRILNLETDAVLFYGC